MTNTKEACPVCARVVAREVFPLSTSRGVRKWSRCPACRSYFDCGAFDLASEVSHTRTRPWGNENGGVKLNVSKDIMYRSVATLLRQHVAPGSSLLDIGCSYGGFMAVAKANGFAVSGMDIVAEAVDHCRGQGFPSYVGASVGDLEIPDSSLDVISVLDCNCYWPDQVRELLAIRRKLRDNGLLAMRVVDKSWMVTIGLSMRRVFASKGNGICIRAVNDHRVSIPVQSMLEILKQQGYDVLYASPKGALHDAKASFAVKTNFALGYWVWRTLGLFVAPGSLILARKQSA
jgi:SAM-dependent methyltransferase